MEMGSWFRGTHVHLHGSSRKHVAGSGGGCFGGVGSLQGVYSARGGRRAVAAGVEAAGKLVLYTAGGKDCIGVCSSSIAAVTSAAAAAILWTPTAAVI